MLHDFDFVAHVERHLLCPIVDRNVDASALVLAARARRLLPDFGLAATVIREPHRHLGNVPANACYREPHASHRVPHDDDAFAGEPHCPLRVSDVVKLANRMVNPMIRLGAGRVAIVEQFVGGFILAPAVDVLRDLDHIEFDRAGSRRELLARVRRMAVDSGVEEIATGNIGRAIQIRRQNHVAFGNVRRLRHPCYPSMPASFLNASRSDSVPCLNN